MHHNRIKIIAKLKPSVVSYMRGFIIVSWSSHTCSSKVDCKSQSDGHIELYHMTVLQAVLLITQDWS